MYISGKYIYECPAVMASFPVFQETEGEWKFVKTVEILGLRIPAYFTSDPQLLYDFITNFKTEPDDVFIVSYPKSGKRISCLWRKRIVAESMGSSFSR